MAGLSHAPGNSGTICCLHLQPRKEHNIFSVDDFLTNDYAHDLLKWCQSLLAQAIVSQVDDEYPNTTRTSVPRVNKHLYATVQLVVHRRKTLSYRLRDVEATQKGIQAWLTDPFMLRSIREIEVIGNAYWERVVREADSWASLVDLVSQAARLTKFSFDYRGSEFPLVLLEALQTHHPRVQLHIWNHYRDHANPSEQALATSPILSSIKSHILNEDGESIELRLAAFQRILATAPNLKFASVQRSASRLTVRSIADHAREEDAIKKFLPPDLEPNTSIRSLTLDGFDLDKDALMYWGRFVSLPHLESLKCSRGLLDKSYFQTAATLLPNLKRVSLNLSSNAFSSGIGPLVVSFLNDCAPLESLSLWGWKQVVPLNTILRHGPTLKQLQLHEKETLSLETRRKLLTAGEVRRILEECPRLTDFILDMDREDGRWQKDIDRHKEILDTLAQYGRRLRRVQIYLDLGIANKMAGRDGPPPLQRGVPSLRAAKEAERDEPAVNDKAEPHGKEVYQGPFRVCSSSDMKRHAKEVWRILFGDPENRGCRELDIKWGEWERKMGGGLPAMWAEWERNNSKRVKVRPEQRDDRAGEAVVEIIAHGPRGNA